MGLGDLGKAGAVFHIVRCRCSSAHSTRRVGGPSRSIARNWSEKDVGGRHRRKGRNRVDVKIIKPKLPSRGEERERVSSVRNSTISRFYRAVFGPGVGPFLDQLRSWEGIHGRCQ